MQKILLIGSRGLLGTELQKLNTELITPDRLDLDITTVTEDHIALINPDVIINCAAITDNRKIEQDPRAALEVNIIGAARLASICSSLNIRYVYISSDYIYKGDRGNYKEDDEILPNNLYAWTKLGGEASAKAVKNHLIIRTSFGPDKFNYSVAFIDKWASKDYIDRIAPLILEAAISPITGVLNIGTERKTLYDHASERNSVEPVKLSDTSFSTPYDTSLNLQKWLDYKSSTPIARPHTNCRVCGSDRMRKYLDLGLMPLANNLEITSLRARQKERFPLQMLFCEECGLSQTSVIIDPEKMFSYYTYRSGINAGYIKHCRQMAKDLKEKFKLNENSLMVDIAGNDGSLLKEFKEEIGLSVVNVDPATNLAAISEAQGIETIADFWNIGAAVRIIETNGRHVDLITATNVFAHVDDIFSFIEAAHYALNPEGVIVIECPYLIDYIDNMEYDTSYFEHLSIMSILPVDTLCKQVGMQVISAEKQNIHGGTIRMTIAKISSSHKIDSSVDKFKDLEISQGFTSFDKYKDWSKNVKYNIRNLQENLFSLKKAGAKIAAFGASAKGNTLLNSAGITTDIIDYIIDETPEKVGKFSPGTGIPIVNKQILSKDTPDYIIILAWNFKEAIIEKLRNVYSGKFIIPIPHFEIID